MTFSGCGSCGADLIEDCTCNTPIIVTPGTRERAHKCLDRWLNDCQDHANRIHEHGINGHVGRFELNALFDDEEVTLQAESTILEEV